MMAAAKGMGVPIEGVQTVGTPGKSPSKWNKDKIQMRQIADIKATLTALAMKPANQALGPLHELYDLVAKGEPTEEKKKELKEIGAMIKKVGAEWKADNKAAKAAKASHKEKNP